MHLSAVYTADMSAELLCAKPDFRRTWKVGGDALVEHLTAVRHVKLQFIMSNELNRGLSEAV